LPITFKNSGKLSSLSVSIGQKVKKDDVLAQLDASDLQASLDQAKATLSQQQANYNKLLAGATPEQIQAAQVALSNAQQGASDAAASAKASQASAAQDIQTSQASVQSAQASIQAASDALESAKSQADAKLAADQTAVDNAQKALDASKAVIAASPAVLAQQLEKAKDDLWAAQIQRDANCSKQSNGACEASRATVAGLETAVTNFNATAAQTQKQNDQTVQQAQNALDTAKAALASDQTAQAAAVKTAENSLHAAEASFNTAQANVQSAQVKAAASSRSAEQTANSAAGQVKTAEASLATTSAGPTKADLDAQMAQVVSSLTAVKTAEANLDAATLRAPMNGTVTAISGGVGQWISGGPVSGSSTSTTSGSSSTASSATGGFITLATLDDLQVTANVNEADVGKVALHNPVTFTVSAFPGKTFTGEVTQIQPTGTTTSNVVNFAVTSSIKSLEGAALYPGMTAQVTITTAEHKDVVLVPNTALTYAKNAGQNGAVMTLAQGRPTAAKVTTGMTDGTNTEIVSGLTAGQPVVTGQTGGNGSGAARTGTGTGGQRAGQGGSPLTGGGPPAGFRGG
jgi:multidrug efflux pump subunit AcrA (membrane-fusion protein)